MNPLLILLLLSSALLLPAQSLVVTSSQTRDQLNVRLLSIENSVEGFRPVRLSFYSTEDVKLLTVLQAPGVNFEVVPASSPGAQDRWIFSAKDPRTPLSGDIALLARRETASAMPQFVAAALSGPDRELSVSIIEEYDRGISSNRLREFLLQLFLLPPSEVESYWASIPPASQFLRDYFPTHGVPSGASFIISPGVPHLGAELTLFLTINNGAGLVQAMSIGVSPAGIFEQFSANTGIGPYLAIQTGPSAFESVFTLTSPMTQGAALVGIAKKRPTAMALTASVKDCRMEVGAPNCEIRNWKSLLTEFEERDFLRQFLAGSPLYTGQQVDQYASTLQPPSPNSIRSVVELPKVENQQPPSAPLVESRAITGIDHVHSGYLPSVLTSGLIAPELREMLPQMEEPTPVYSVWTTPIEVTEDRNIGVLSVVTDASILTGIDLTLNPSAETNGNFEILAAFPGKEIVAAEKLFLCTPEASTVRVVSVTRSAIASGSVVILVVRKNGDEWPTSSSLVKSAVGTDKDGNPVPIAVRTNESTPTELSKKAFNKKRARDYFKMNKKTARAYWNTACYLQLGEDAEIQSYCKGLYERLPRSIVRSIPKEVRREEALNASTKSGKAVTAKNSSTVVKNTGTISPCDVNADGFCTDADVRLAVAQLSGGTCTLMVAGYLVCNVIAVQRISNAASGGRCVVTHFARVTWTAASNATGYNLYRSSTCTGGFAKVNTSLITGTGYTDYNVVAGQSVCYVGRSYNASYNPPESTDSKPSDKGVPRIIPSP